MHIDRSKGDVENLLLFFTVHGRKLKEGAAMIFFFNMDKRVTLYEHFSFASNLVTYYFWIKYIRTYILQYEYKRKTIFNTFFTK